MTVRQMSRQSSRKSKAMEGKLGEDLWTRTIVVADACPKEMIPKGRSWKPSDFDITKTLFVGKRSVIYRARCMGCGQDLVLKVYVKNRLAAVHRKQVEREIQIHSSLSHPNIITMYAAFEDANHVYLMVESAPKGDLLDDMNKRETFYPQQTILKFVSQLLDAINYLHKRGIMHRDMKPENIVLVDNNYSIKIIDFGLSIDFSVERPVSAVGTLQYMAPEVVVCPTKSRPEENKENTMLQYGTGADIWALGILVYELLTGRAPFDSGKKVPEEETERRIIYMEPEFPPTLDPNAADFVKRSIAKVPGRRVSAAELLCHRWLNNGVDVPLPTSATPSTSVATDASKQGREAPTAAPQRQPSGLGLQPQLSMVDVQPQTNLNRKKGNLQPERSYMVASAAVKGGTEQQWRFSKDRLHRPVDADLRVTGTPDFEVAVGREEARGYESDKDSAFSRQSSVTSPLIRAEPSTQPSAPETASSQGRWAEPFGARLLEDRPASSGVSLSASYSATASQLKPFAAATATPGASAGREGASMTQASSSPLSTPAPASRLTSAKHQQRGLTNHSYRAESATHSAAPVILSPRPRSSARQQHTAPHHHQSTQASTTTRKSSARAPSSRASVQHTSAAKVEASLRQSMLLAESSAPALSRINAKQQQRAFEKEASESELMFSGNAATSSPTMTSSAIRRLSGMGGYDSYSAMRAALVNGGGAPGTVMTRASQRPGGGGGSARKRSIGQRPTSSKPGRGAEYGRSSVMTRGPQFARWAAGGAAARPGTSASQTQRGVGGGGVPAFGTGWAAQQQQPTSPTLDLVSHGKAIPLSPRS